MTDINEPRSGEFLMAQRQKGQSFRAKIYKVGINRCVDAKQCGPIRMHGQHLKSCQPVRVGVFFSGSPARKSWRHETGEFKGMKRLIKYRKHS